MNNCDRHNLFLLLILVLALAACKETSVEAVSPSRSLTYIEGVLPNWTLGDSITMVGGFPLNLYGRGDSFFIFGTTHVNRDGSFLITLAPPPPEILGPIPGWDVAPCYRLDDSAHFISAWLCLRRPNDSTNYKFLSNNNSNILITSDFDSPAKLGDYWTYIEYVDRDVNMVCDYEMHMGTRPGLTVSVQEHLNYHKGWNRIVSTIVSVMDYSRIIERSIRNTSDGKWHIYP